MTGMSNRRWAESEFNFHDMCLLLAMTLRSINWRSLSPLVCITVKQCVRQCEGEKGKFNRIVKHRVERVPDIWDQMKLRWTRLDEIFGKIPNIALPFLCFKLWTFRAKLKPGALYRQCFDRNVNFERFKFPGSLIEGLSALNINHRHSANAIVTIGKTSKTCSFQVDTNIFARLLRNQIPSGMFHAPKFTSSRKRNNWASEGSNYSFTLDLITESIN